MKLVEGGNLAERLASFRGDPRTAASLLAEVAEAVHHALVRGILHRDLKPANILVDDEGHPHVTDFGLAKRVEGDVEMTASGAILGTPAYMSPEQANGRRGSITTATDVYGLGAILYALTTGKAPFGGDGLIETLDAVRTRPPESPKKFNAHVPRDLETICLKCPEKDPHRRYASAHELAVDLHNWLDPRPITARRVGVAERTWLWCKRKPAVAVLAAVAGTGAVIAVQTRANGILERKNVDLQESNTALNQQRARAEDRETQAIDAVNRFGGVVANEPAMRNTPALVDLRKRLLKEPLAFVRALRDRLQAERDTRPDSLARLDQASFDLGRLTDGIGDNQDALIAYRESLAIRQMLADANPAATDFQRDLANSHGGIGVQLGATGKPAEAMKAYESAPAIQQRLAREHPESPDFAHALGGTLNNRAGFDLNAKRSEEARARLREAVKWQRKALASNPANPGYRQFLANHFVNLIDAARGLGDAEGEAEARRELAELRDSAPAMAALDARLSSIIQGEAPRSNAERLAVAQRAYEESLHAAAAKLFADALDADSKLTDDRQAQTRYNTACATSRAAAGQGKDDPPLDVAAKVRLRKQALDWLKAELSAWKRVSMIVEPGNKETVAKTLAHWKQDADLAGIRDEQELAKLAEAERAVRKALWADVDALLKRVEKPTS